MHGFSKFFSCIYMYLVIIGKIYEILVIEGQLGGLTNHSKFIRDLLIIPTKILILVMICLFYINYCIFPLNSSELFYANLLKCWNILILKESLLENIIIMQNHFKRIIRENICEHYKIDYFSKKKPYKRNEIYYGKLNNCS